MSYVDKPSLNELVGRIDDSIDDIAHIGVKRRSGRYPWGSGDQPYQRSGDFLARVEELKKQGLKETEIARSMGFVDPKTNKCQTTKLRAQLGLAKDERRADLVNTIKSMKSDGLNNSEIARKLGKNESTIRSLLDKDSEARMNAAKNLADFIKKQVDEKGMIDVGTGVERELGDGISKEKMKQALEILKMEGYPVYGGGVPQITNPGKQTNIQVICPPGTEHKAIYNFADVHSLTDYVSYDGGDTFKKAFVYPESMDSKRLKIRYADDLGPDGHPGVDKDGVIEIRRGVPDLDLGNSQYAQVRIMVDGTHYLKGMAVYSDNLPDGVDVVFNTNKSKDVAALGPKDHTVLKNIKKDPDNPFGSALKEHGGQSYYTDKDGNEHLSLINKTREEGDWGEWSKSLPAQFLSKQSMQLIKKQLDLAVADKQTEYDEICSLTNPTVKKVLLKSFSDDCDSTAVHLDAASLPRQRYQVILPAPTMKDNEVYAPNYNDGETVALIRYPHGGIFEIPILKVNNKQPDAKKMYGNALDAVGINKKNADRLSGADFDGDTVMVIPCNSSRSKVHINSSKELDGLKDFDPKMKYPYHEGMKVMNNTQNEMGRISNLITDMTLKGANEDELARAVRHSMVVIDAEKHKLDYKKSEADNGIAALKKDYQGRMDENGRLRTGASTLISQAKSPYNVLKTRGSAKIDPETGELSYTHVIEEYTDKNGKVKKRTQKSTKMAETKDAFTLSSGTPQEEAYANYANKMKALANQARKEMITTGKIKYDSNAKATYGKEVSSLMSKLNEALKNAPRERQAQIMANAEVSAKKKDNPGMTKEELKKAQQRALANARSAVGAKRTNIPITDREWEAIQAGAISENKLMSILNNTDTDAIRQRATPRTTTTLTTSKINKLKSMRASGYTNAEIADDLGVSTGTIAKYLKGKE